MVPLTFIRTTFRRFLYVALACILILSTITVISKPAQAAVMQTRTGVYVGTGANFTVANLGFQPDLIILKPATSANSAFFKTSAMPANTTAHFAATAVSTASLIVLSNNGFTASSTLSAANVPYHWIAVGGSDCTSSGTFCVGSYTGNGASTQNITTGFQPDMVLNKRTTAISPTFRTASMPANTAEYFSNATAITNGTHFTTLNQTSFTVGSTYSASGGLFYFFAFAKSAQMKEGTFTGDGTDNRNITGLGFTPAAVFAKNVTSATATNKRAVLTTTYHYGDHASYTGDGIADTTNILQGLNSDGFQVGAGFTNETSTTIYWFAFGIEPALAAGTGSFDLREGVYTGTGAALTIDNLPFKPDLVIIKDDAANFAAFRTSIMGGDTTAYLSAATGNFTGGVTALLSDGFTIGTNTVVNTTGNTYRWQAFSNAYNQSTQTGAADFMVGAYYGNGIDNRNITGLPFQPDLVSVKTSSAATGAFRTSSVSGDSASYFSAASDSANLIQSINSNGFQVGTNASTNNASSVHWWFAFKAGTNFRVGTYTGNAVSPRLITTSSFGPQYMWVKRAASATPAMARSSSIIDENSQSFTNAANVTDNIVGFNGGGFTVGSTLNASGATYRYAVWRQPLTQSLTTNIVDQDGAVVASPSVSFQPYTANFSCQASTAVLGTTLQKIRVSNLGSTPSWTTSIAATQGQAATWVNGDTSKKYDYNDLTNNGCDDGADSDTYGGSLRVQPSGAVITPQQACSTTGITAGSDQSFSEGSVSSITLATGSSSADTGCYWDITNVGLRQTIPNEQLPDNYQLQLSITTVAS